MSEIETPRPAYSEITVDIYRLQPNPRNYNVHSQLQIDELKESLKRYGQVKPVVAQSVALGEYMLLAGHGLREAALQLLEESEETYKRFRLFRVVIVSNWSQEDAHGYMMADNETARKAQADLAKLAELIQEQKDAGYDLASVGSSEQELACLLEKLANEQLQENDEVLDRELADPVDGEVTASFGVLVECVSEDEQERIYERLTQEGYVCRVLTL